MMNEISIAVDWSSLLPIHLEVRVMAFLIGIGLWIHLQCMAALVPKKCPWSLAILMGISAASGVALMIGAVVSNVALLFLSFMVGLASTLSILLWLWLNGMHVSRFIEDCYGTHRP